MAMNIDSNSEMCGTVMNKAVSEAPSSGRPAVITVESEIYELQLTQLQEQLITAMIENEQLSKGRHYVSMFEILLPL